MQKVSQKGETDFQITFLALRVCHLVKFSYNMIS